MNITKLSFIIMISFIVSACSNDQALRNKANVLAHKFIITDGHIDVPWRLNKGYEDLSVRTKSGDFDYVRAKEGGLDVPFMSIYIPSSYLETGGAKEKADSLIDMVNQMADNNPDKFEVAYSVADANRIFEEGKIALPMGMENGAGIEDDIRNLKYFYDRGIRYITLTHSKDNLICDSSYDDSDDTWGGLSPYGRKVVKEMNRLGIMVDVSHVTDEVINQVMDMSDVPVIASHSSCRYYTKGWERNMGDDEIRRLKDNGGVIQINFGSRFISPETDAYANNKQAAVEEYCAKPGANCVNWTAPAEFEEEYRKTNPYPFATTEQVVDHIDHVVKLAGIDHVGIGSDYDGVGDSLPVGLKDVSTYPNLIYHLLKRGYSEEDIEKICYKNFWRVWSAVEAYAQK
ncbi:MAG: peptidase M19 [Candidatus Marinimicrobia bacterium]|nr:peptidase M19 [Candidatus Neomarinimicrobiota bacterium]